MSADQRKFAVGPESPVMTVIHESIEKQRFFMEAIKTFKEEIGAEDIWTWESAQICGVTFSAIKPPTGWRIDQRKGYCVPAKATPAGKALAKRFEDFPRGVTARSFSWQLNKALGLRGFEKFSDCHVYWTSFEKIGDQFVLSVPVPCGITEVAGCTPLKMSEYWAMKESTHAAE